MGVGAAIGIGSVIGGGLSYLGAKSSSRAAKKAAKYQAVGADKSIEAQLEMYHQTREDMGPWREAGERGLGLLEGGLEDYGRMVRFPDLYKESAGFDWLRQQGEEAMFRGASAGGRLDEGGLPKDFARYNMGLASQDYGNYLSRFGDLLNRYSGLAGTGQTATTALGQLGQQTAANVGQSYLAQGTALGGGAINQANARTGLYSNLSQIGSNALNQYLLYNYLGGTGGGGAASGGAAGGAKITPIPGVSSQYYPLLSGTVV